MPSQLHEVLASLFDERPTLAAELLRDVLRVDWLPRFTGARRDAAKVADLKPPEYRADAVIVVDDRGNDAYGIIVEVQLTADEDKRFTWPNYATYVRARHEVPVCVLVVAVDEAIARWAAEPIYLGGGNWFKPLVLQPSNVPEVVDGESVSAELAVLSSLMHGPRADVGKALQILRAQTTACRNLDEGRQAMYLDLTVSVLSETVQQELRNMDPAKYQYQSQFAKHYLAEGKAKGKAEGRAEGRAEGLLEGRAGLVARQLTLRFGPLDGDTRARISAASLEELDAIGERLLSAQSLREALGRH